MAKLKPFRCQNSACSTDSAGRLIFDFWAERPVCPKCKTDGKQNPQIVVPLALIHFDLPHATIKQTPMATHKGQGLRACDGTPCGLQRGATTEVATANPEVVNCPACKITPAWKKAAEEWGVEELTPEAEEQLVAVLRDGKDRLAEVFAATATTTPPSSTSTEATATVVP